MNHAVLCGAQYTSKKGPLTDCTPSCDLAIRKKIVSPNHLADWIACLGVDGFCTYSKVGVINLKVNSLLESHLIEEGAWNGCASGDTVKMIIDCEKWRVELYKNGKFNVRVKISENSKHYLILGSDQNSVFHWKLLD